MDDLIRARDLVKKLGMAPRTISDWAVAGKIPYVKVGDRVRFSPKMIEEWLQQNTHKPVE